MKIHEYQGKELLKNFGVVVPRGWVARSPEEAYQAAKELATDVVVVKAQIHAGGRGKGGGVKLAKSADEAREIARKMLGMKLVTHQTGPEGRQVRVLLIEEGLPIDKEFYLGIGSDLIGQAVKFMQSLYLAYEQMDASLMEINPFLLTRDKRLMALDAKVNFDDNALFRHKEFLDLRDLNEEEPLEIEASKFDLNYIKLDGNIA